MEGPPDGRSWLLFEAVRHHARHLRECRLDGRDEERVLGLEMAIKAAMGQPRLLHHVADARASDAIPPEQPAAAIVAEPLRRGALVRAVVRTRDARRKRLDRAGVEMVVADLLGTPNVPTTKVIAIGSVTAKWTSDAIRTVMPQKVRCTVRLYLAGKVDQWYVRRDRPGVEFILNMSEKMLDDLPLGREGLMTFEVIPLGPLAPLGLLASGNAPAATSSPSP